MFVSNSHINTNSILSGARGLILRVRRRIRVGGCVAYRIRIRIRGRVL